MNKSTLLAIAALSMAGINATAVETYVPAQKPPTRHRPKVKRMVTSASDEIKQWNAEVDARKAAKRGEA